jgi:hypothetical protein
VANTLAYYDTATITAIKSFIVQTHWSPFLTRKQKKNLVKRLAAKVASFQHFLTMPIHLFINTIVQKTTCQD